MPLCLVTVLGKLVGAAAGEHRHTLFKLTVAVPLWINVTVPLGVLALTGGGSARAAGRAAVGRRGDTRRRQPEPATAMPPTGSPPRSRSRSR